MNSDVNSRRFHQLCEGILRGIWQSNTVGATILGIHDYDDTFGDLSADCLLGFAKSFREYRSALQSEVDPSLLDAEDMLDYHLALCLATTNDLMLECERPWAKNPSIYPSLGIWGCFSLLVREFAPFEDRMRSMLGRMQAVPEMLMSCRENISNPAPVFVQVAHEVVPGATAFFRDVVSQVAASLPSMENELLIASRGALQAFLDFDRWLREDGCANAHGDFAIGAEVYEQKLFGEHYLTYGPNDLVLLANRVLDNTELEIREVAKAIDPTVSWQELVTSLKQDHPPKDRLEAAYHEAMRSARQFVIDHDLVTLAGDDYLGVGTTPEFERSVMPYAAYFPPAPFETSKHGCLWVTPINRDAPEEQQMAQLEGHCVHAIPIIALHEGYPGHHLQLTKAMDIPSRIRRQMMNGLLVEGWALYCEELMREQGFYTDPRVELFQLKDLLWRACRVIIDVGLHTGQMAFQEAVDMLVNVAAIEEVNAIAEVKRYAMDPTQPMTYVIGKLLILDLRDRMKRKSGGRFDLKAFHDQLLSYGSIPPALIAEQMISGLVHEPEALRRSA